MIVSNTPDDSIFLAPLAASPLRRHADHILARETALHLLKQGRGVNFYPDAPYMNLPSSGREQSLHKIVRRAEHSLGFAVTAKVKKLDAHELGIKCRSMQAYKSQYVMTDLFSLGGLGRIGRRNYELVFEPKR